MPSRLRGRAGAALVVLTVLTGLLAGCSATGADEPTRSSGQTGYVGNGDQSITKVAPDQRKQAPEFSGPELGTDDTLSSQDYAGKVIVLNVWASWCGPCRQEGPDLQKVSVETAKKAQFIGLNTRDPDQAPAVAFARSNQVTYPSLYDPKGQVLLLFAADLPPSFIPSTLILDAQHRIAVRILGPITAITLADLVDDVAAGR